MFMQSPPVERLLESLRRLPGVGKKSAERYALHLLTLPPEICEEFSQALISARRAIDWCPICKNLTDIMPCALCQDDKRDQSIICVVERPTAVIALEKGGAYRGLYHVLHGVINPLEGIGPEALQVDSLMDRIKKQPIKEIIIATNTTAEGEVTALYLARRMAEYNIPATRIAHGVPMGGGLEYADEITLSRALEGRLPL
jgi:recombination protein RecR